MSGRLVVLSTVGAEDEAARIARALVEQKLAACVNVLPGISSFYRWKGKIARDAEWLLVMKTTEARFEDLRKALVELHPYDVPEVVALPVERGHEAYLEWVDESTRSL